MENLLCIYIVVNTYIWVQWSSVGNFPNEFALVKNFINSISCRHGGICVINSIFHRGILVFDRNVVRDVTKFFNSTLVCHWFRMWFSIRIYMPSSALIRRWAPWATQSSMRSPAMIRNWTTWKTRWFMLMSTASHSWTHSMTRIFRRATTSVWYTKGNNLWANSNYLKSLSVLIVALFSIFKF